MKTYKAYITQEGGGCDYTIACGETILNLEATTLEEAQQEVLKEIKEDYSGDERRLEKVELYEIENIFALDIQAIYKHIDTEKLQAKQKQKEEKERQEFERLKTKFG